MFDVNLLENLSFTSREATSSNCKTISLIELQTQVQGLELRQVEL